MTAVTRTGRAVARAGRHAGDRIGEVGTFVIFAQRVLSHTIFDVVFRLRYRKEVVRQISDVVVGPGALVAGSGMVFVVGAMSLATGATVGIEGFNSLRGLGAESFTGLVASFGNTREVAPIIFGVALAAQVGAGFTAELGAMRISDEIDALDVMGMDSMLYLCSTRLLATWIILPLIYGVAMLASFLGSFISVVLQIGQVSAGGYLQLFWKFQNPTDFLFSGIKGMAMATFVVLVGCFYGYKVRGGPVEVGTATARAMVVNLLGVHVIGILGSQLFWGGAPRLPIGG
jgi:phospholipid/cholesterol/gamma-HCH transport system permease protein